jgi:hypothetical protein
MSDIQRITVYAVYETVGYGRRGKFLGLFDDQYNADIFANGKGWYGGKGDVQKCDAILIDGRAFPLANFSGPYGLTLNDPEAIKVERIRREALNKLSTEERVALGLE